MNRMLLLLFCAGLIGCATATPSKYVTAYNEAVSNGNSTVVIKEGDFETVKSGVDHQLLSIGYNKIIYSNPNEEFAVFVKDIDYGNPLVASGKHAYMIILKYTKLTEGKTRIDLVNGSTEEFTKDEIDGDMHKLVELIKS